MDILTPTHSPVSCQSYTPDWMPLRKYQATRGRVTGEALEHFSQTLAPYRALNVSRPPQLGFLHHRARLGGMHFNSIWYETGHRMHAMLPEGTFYIVYVLGGSATYLANGEVLVARQGTIVVHNPDCQLECEMSDDFRQIVIQLDADRLIEIFQNELGGAPVSKLRFDSCQLSADGAGASLARFILLCCEELDAQAYGLQSRVIERHYMQMLALLLLEIFPHSHSSLLAEPLATVTPYYVRRAEEFIRKNYMESIALEDIAEAAGVSARSLHNGFRQFRNLSPMTFLKMIRLEYARRELATAARRGLSVTGVALNNGFNHMSKFGADYRQRYGELPSETWRRHR